MTVALFAGVGFFGASSPMVIALGRAFFPPHLVGRGVTLLNLFGIGATGLAQMATGRLHAATAGGTAMGPALAPGQTGPAVAIRPGAKPTKDPP